MTLLANSRPPPTSRRLGKMGSAGRRESAPSDLPSEFASSITQFGSPAGHEPTAALRASVRRHRSHLGRRLRRPLIWQSDADWPGPRLSCGRPRSFFPSRTEPGIGRIGFRPSLYACYSRLVNGYTGGSARPRGRPTCRPRGDRVVVCVNAVALPSGTADAPAPGGDPEMERLPGGSWSLLTRAKFPLRIHRACLH